MIDCVLYKSMYIYISVKELKFLRNIKVLWKVKIKKKRLNT